MTWNENPIKNDEGTIAPEITLDTPPQTPRWVRMFFKTLGIFSFIFVIFSAFSLFLPTYWNGTIPPYFILTPIVSVIGLSIAGFGFITLKRWILPMLYIYGVSNVLQFVYYAITGGYGDTSILIPLIGTLLIIGLCLIAYLQHSSFSGNYFHSLFSTLLIVCMIAGFILTIMMSKNAAFDFLISDNTTSSEQKTDLGNITEQKEKPNENISTYEQNINANKNLKITFTAPVGGEQWEAGSSYFVKWNTDGFGRPPHYLQLMQWGDGPNGEPRAWTTDSVLVISNGIQEITLPINVVPNNNYAICVYGSSPWKFYEGGLELGCSEKFSINETEIAGITKWKYYNNPVFHVRFLYPESWPKLEGKPMGDGISIIADPGDNLGFGLSTASTYTKEFEFMKVNPKAMCGENPKDYKTQNILVGSGKYKATKYSCVAPVGSLENGYPLEDTLIVQIWIEDIGLGRSLFQYTAPQERAAEKAHLMNAILSTFEKI